jgi:serine/threonine-protein kinase
MTSTASTPVDEVGERRRQQTGRGSELIGSDLGSFRVLEKIGSGGMATVYSGEHRFLAHRVAIKVLHKHLVDDELMTKRFFEEARAVASVRHPSIVQLYDFGYCPDGRAYIVMEMLEGESMRERLRSGAMDEREVVTFGRQISAALAKAHEHGIVHRDLKPDNIFIVPDSETELGERAKVLDFGVAKNLQPGHGELTAIGALVGTPSYMSPEQCLGQKDIDHRTDIYSLGVLVYAMACGRKPFWSPETDVLLEMHLRHEPIAPRERNPRVSEDLQSIILRCMRKRPDERFQSMAALERAFAGAGGGRASAPLPANGDFANPGDTVPFTREQVEQMLIAMGAQPERAEGWSAQITAVKTPPPVRVIMDRAQAAMIPQPQAQRYFTDPPRPATSPTNSVRNTALACGLVLAVLAGVITAALVL